MLENIFLCDHSVLENFENGIHQLHIYVCIGIELSSKITKEPLFT